MNEKGLLGGGSTADPKLQETAKMYLANGLRLIHSQEVSDGIIKKLQTVDDPVPQIADSTLDIVNRVESSAAGKGVSLPPEYLAQVANVLMGEIIGIAEIAGVKPLNEEDRYKAFSLAVSKYLAGSVESGKMSPEQLQQMGQQAMQTPKGQEIVKQVGDIKEA